MQDTPRKERCYRKKEEIKWETREQAFHLPHSFVSTPTSQQPTVCKNLDEGLDSLSFISKFLL